jgi:hypothetical protein
VRQGGGERRYNLPYKKMSYRKYSRVPQVKYKVIGTTVKRPKFDILFGENIFFLKNLFR